LETCDKHAGLKSRIRAVYERHRGHYGYRRITAAYSGERDRRFRSIVTGRHAC